jgi:hypothetical protein
MGRGRVCVPKARMTSGIESNAMCVDSSVVVAWPLTPLLFAPLAGAVWFGISSLLCLRKVQSPQSTLIRSYSPGPRRMLDLYQVRVVAILKMSESSTVAPATLFELLRP